MNSKFIQKLYRNSIALGIALELLFSGSVALAQPGRDSAKPALAPMPIAKPVKVRQGPMTVKRFTPHLTLSKAPSDEEITTARVFLEPLIPLNTKSVSGENAALAQALKSFKTKNNPDDVSDLTNFLKAFPHSRWLATVELHEGLRRLETGYVTDALTYLTSAWNLSKGEKTSPQTAVADRAISELMCLEARLGEMDSLRAHLSEIADRPMYGSNEERVNEARQGMAVLQSRPGTAFKCGPLALNTLLYLNQTRVEENPILKAFSSTNNGTNLAQVNELADKVGLNYQMAKRSKGAQIIVPSVMHWKVGHFAALTSFKNGKYQIKDPTFGRMSNLWISPEAIESQSDGYFLVPAGQLPTGWQSVSQAEAEKVWGKGYSIATDPGKGPGTPTTGPSCPARGGMAQAQAYTMQATLNVFDMPLGYSPPLGPDMNFLVNYNYLEGNQPGTFTFPNFGPDWSFNWVSYMSLDASNNATISVRGGGFETYPCTTPDNVSNPYPPSVLSQAQLIVVGNGVYQRRLSDGSMEVFDQADGTGRIFMTKVIDGQGNMTTISYDANFRITSITDALGQSTTLSYRAASPPTTNPLYYQIAQISDPFSRTATFVYDSTNTRIASITDVIGLVSSFVYDTSSSQIASMTSPYGTTSFYSYTPATPTGDNPAQGLRFTFPDGTVSVIENYVGEAKTTYYWDREAMALYPGDPASQIYSHARMTRFKFNLSNNTESAVRWYTKPPLESTTTFFYDNGGDTNASPLSAKPTLIRRDVGNIGSSQTQDYAFQYNVFGHATKSIDPLGRTFSYNYSANGVDLLEARQTQGANNDLLGKWIYSNTSNQHLPTSKIDSSGQKWLYLYNPAGQLVTSTDPNGNSTTMSYIGAAATIGGTVSGNTATITVTDPSLTGGLQAVSYTGSGGDTASDVAEKLALAINTNTNLSDHGFSATASGAVVTIGSSSKNATTYATSVSGAITATLSYITRGYLTKIDGPLPGNADASSYTYDGYGRVFRAIDSENYVVEFSYDAADRPTKISYKSYTPDTTTTEYIYDKLDNVMAKDRDGRWTTSSFDSMDQMVSSMDPLGRKTTYMWCACGSLHSLTDPAGNKTNWEHDLEGRVTQKTYADASHIDYAYDDLDSRLKTKTNARGQVQTFSYNLDDSVSQITYSDSSTSAVSVCYDSNYLRKTSMENGWGTSIYAYNPTIQDPYKAANIWLSGKPVTNDTVTVTFTNAGIPGSPLVLSYTVTATDTDLPTLAKSVAAAINGTTALQTAGVTASVQAASGRTVAIGGTKQTDDVLTLTFTDPAISGGSATVSYKVTSGDTLSSIATALASNINNDGRLSALGIKAKAVGSVVSMQMNSPNQTSLARTTSGGSTETVTVDTSPSIVAISAVTTLGTVGLSAVTAGSGGSNPGETANFGGAGRLQGVGYAIAGSTNPYPSTTYSFDKLGRTTNRSINGAANAIAWDYDAMSRVTSETNGLGFFGYTYVDNTSGSSKGVTRLASVAYPNGQNTNFSWYGNTGDQRLQTISNLNPSSSTLSQFDYIYDPVGQITQWRQQQNAANVYYNLGYDLAGQLTTAQTGGASQPPYTDQYYYAYDAAGNRSAEEVVTSSSNSVTQAGFNNTNELTGLAPGGLSRFQGTTNKAVKSAAVATNVISLKSTSTNATTYTFTSGSSATFVTGANLNGNQSARIDGTAVATDSLTIRVTNNGLPSPGYKDKTYTVPASPTLVSIAGGMAALVNGDTDLQSIGVTASSTSPASLIYSKSFTTNVPLTTESGGNNRTDVFAIDGGNNLVTNNYQVAVTGPGSKTLTYDLDGNMTSDGTNSYSWDQENRLLQITYSSGNNSAFSYDSSGRCVKIVETTSSSVTSTKQFTWCGSDRCEVRDASGNLTNQYFSLGQTNISGSTSKYLYTTDHLGSVREMVTNDGSATIQSQYSYDPYGRQTKIAGSGPDADFGYAGYYVHARSGLNLTRTRAYSASLGRFISRDPIEEAGGLNLYRYVRNNPVSFTDPMGLIPTPQIGAPRGDFGNGPILGEPSQPYQLGPIDPGSFSLPPGFTAPNPADVPTFAPPLIDLPPYIQGARYPQEGAGNGGAGNGGAGNGGAGNGGAGNDGGGNGKPDNDSCPANNAPPKKKAPDLSPIKLY